MCRTELVALDEAIIVLFYLCILLLKYLFQILAFLVQLQYCLFHLLAALNARQLCVQRVDGFFVLDGLKCQLHLGRLGSLLRESMVGTSNIQLMLQVADATFAVRARQYTDLVICQ